MKIATWNVNSLSVRLPQVLAWLSANPVDALCLQELKMTDDKFPFDAFQAAGYQATAFGQKTYNGVALITREPVDSVVRNIPGFADEQSRVIAATLPTPDGPLRLPMSFIDQVIRPLAHRQWLLCERSGTRH